MKTLSIRRWLVLSLLALFVVPALLFNLALPLFGGPQGWWAARTQPSSTALDAAAGLFTTPGSWNDPSWQQGTREQLTQLRLGAEVRDQSGAVIFRSGMPPQTGPPWARNWSGSSTARRIQVVQAGTSAGTVDLFPEGESGGGFGGAALAALTGLALTLLAVGWLIGRYVVRPLEATSRAARQIARSDLDFALPDSRVREVAEVRAAFDAMGAGLRDSIERQAELEAERRFFVGAVAHDLRTPLFSLRGYLQGIERGVADTPEKVAAYVAICSQKADQLERLVADLFAFARADVLEDTLCAEPLELDAFLTRVADGFRERANAKGVALRVTGATTGCPVSCDPHLLERAVENLLDNALRHTPPGGAIDLSWCYEGERALFRVTDSGVGIDERDLPHLFEPLYRGEASRSRETGGAGLGLTIARRILRAHDGDLTAANRSEGGAQFTGWLPVRVQ